MAKKKQNKKTNPSELISPHAKEGFGLLLITVAILTCLSLISYSYGTESTNWIGMVGQSIGWLFITLFGIPSYLIALYIGWIGTHFLISKPIDRLPLRTVYLSVAIASLCFLLSLAEDALPNFRVLTAQWVFPHTPPRSPLPYAGGRPFVFLYRELPFFNLKEVLNNVGVAVLFTSTFFASVIFFSSKSVVDVLYKGLALLGWTVTSIRSGINRVYTWLKERPVPVEAPIKEAPKRNTLKLKLPMIHEPQPHEEEIIEEEPPFPPKPRKKAPPKETKEMARELALEAQSVWNGDFARYKFPAANQLTSPTRGDQSSLKEQLRQQAKVLEETLLSFGIEAKVGEINCGPTITSFEVHPAVGVKVQSIRALQNDIALNMQAKSIRIIAPIPGKAAVGIEVPNPNPQEVSFKDLLYSYKKREKKYEIPLLLGQAVTGEYVMNDLTKMPHCIIAGATGSGKSVCINTIVMSILFNAKPDEIQLIMVDPKKVELTPFTKLPHMIAPVVTEPHGAYNALQWLVREMEKRYELLKHIGKRNIIGFNNRKIDKAKEDELPMEVPEKLPYIVMIVDELADLMMVANCDIETPIARIAQMARAVGIHLILATQRPSREVITGLIKANFPTRISFKVSSRVNSQIILDETGAEHLLGNGDMLFLPPGTSHFIRAQGAFIREEDIHQVIDTICAQTPPSYQIESFDSLTFGNDKAAGGTAHGGGDELYDQALEVVVGTGNASTTFLQRKLKIGYARAASLMDQLEENGVVGTQDGSRARKVLIAGGGED